MHFHCVQPRIRRGQACIGNMQIAQFDTPVVFRVEDVGTKCRGRSEVNRVGVGGNVFIAEECTAGEFKVRREAAVAFEIPLEAEGIETCAVSSIGGLENQIDRNYADCVFKSSAKQAGQVWTGEHPSVAAAEAENSGIGGAAGNGMAAR